MRNQKEVVNRRENDRANGQQKVDKIMPFTFAYMEDINVLVSDDSLDEEIVREANGGTFKSYKFYGMIAPKGFYNDRILGVGE